MISILEGWRQLKCGHEVMVGVTRMKTRSMTRCITAMTRNNIVRKPRWITRSITWHKYGQTGKQKHNQVVIEVEMLRG